MTNRLLLILCIVTLISCGEKKPQSRLSSDGSDLKVGEVVGRRTLALHTTDSFKLNLGAKAFVYGYADQHDVDVVVRIFGPDHAKMAEFDGPARGPESFKFTTAVEGVHTIAISPFENLEGEYSVVVSGAEAVATDPEGRVDQVVRAAADGDQKAPGVAIAVQRDGKLIYDKGFGYADLEQNAKITPTTIFHIASVSKQFTAFAIAMLADQGKLSLDDDIRKYLPEMHDFGTPITIRQLGHHTSGLRDQWSLLMMAGWRLDDVITYNHILKVASKQTELNFKPGDEHVYCNTGFTLMAEIVHRVTKESFSVWCGKNIFDPLGMKNTLFYDDHERVVENRAYSYHRGSNGYQKSVLSYANAGATSLFTTVEDLSLWAQNFEKMTVGNQNIMNTMEHKFVLNNGDSIDYAFGQAVNKYKGLKAVSHGGADAGYRSFFIRFPEQHFSIAVFSNNASFPVGGLAFELADLYLEKEFKPEQPPQETPPPSNNNNQSDETPFDPKSVNLSDYTGFFYSPELDTRYEFVVVNDTLVSHHQRHDNWKLRGTKVDQFNINILGTLDFYREKGKVAGFRASNGRVRNLKFVKQ
ncbi:MAG TPA: serine hydrolase domain-containing protein [Cyclobacteriaceae bacterium]|nr:serine hydrolase domain-containing protein [Cyclobacteriaceae bacterium]